MRATPDPRRRRSPGDGATLVGVTRLRQILVSRPRQAPDGHKQGGTQPTNISMINRRGYWLRLFHGSVSYDHVIHSRGGPGPPDAKRARLDIGSHINAPPQPRFLRRRLQAVVGHGDHLSLRADHLKIISRNHDRLVTGPIRAVQVLHSFARELLMSVRRESFVRLDRGAKVCPVEFIPVQR
jgi:hypothetical protein